MNDKHSVLALAEEHAVLFGRGALSSIAADKGYWSQENLRGLSALGVKEIGLQHPSNIKRTVGLPDQETQERLRNRRAGIEALIGRTKHQQGLHGVVVIPTMIYGTGLGLKKTSIQVPMLERVARQRGHGVYIGAGENIWSHVHIADLVELYRLAVEKAPSGSFYYAESGKARLRDVVAALHEGLGLKGEPQSIRIDEGIALWGLEAAKYALASNSVVDAGRARGELGWQPEGPRLLTWLVER